MNNSTNELLEFIREQLPYTEAELKEKPILQFMDIVERAKKRAEVATKNAKRQGK